MKFVVVVVLILCFCLYVNCEDAKSEMEFQFEGNWYTESEFIRLWEQQKYATQELNDGVEETSSEELNNGAEEISGDDLGDNVDDRAKEETFMNFIDEKLSKLSHLFMSEEYLKEHKHDDETHLEFILNNITNYMTFDKLKEHTEAAATVIPEHLSKMSQNIRTDSKKRYSYFISLIGVVLIGFLGRSLLNNFLHIKGKMKMEKIKKAE